MFQNSFLRDISRSAYIQLLGSEYSVPGGPVISQGTLVGSKLIEIPTTQPANDPTFAITYADVQSMIDTGIQSGVIPAPSVNSCYVVFFASTLVVDPGGKTVGSTSGGFHSVFRTKAGVNSTYCVVDASDVGGSNTTFYASHELVEAITNPDNDGAGGAHGWFDSNTGQEIADVCFDGDNLNGPPTFHGYSIARFWSNGQNRCVAPTEDNQTIKGASLRISVGGSDCVVEPIAGAVATFTVSASLGGLPESMNNIKWIAQEGAQLVGPANQPTCKIKSPATAGSFRVVVSATDSFGCQLQVVQTFYCVTVQQSAWQEELCRLRHVILENWRLINPIWGPPEHDFSYRPVRANEVLRVKEVVSLLDKLISHLEKQPANLARERAK